MITLVDNIFEVTLHMVPKKSETQGSKKECFSWQALGHV